MLQELAVRLAGSAVFAVATNPYAFARTTAVRLAIDWRRKQAARPEATALIEPTDESPTPLATMARAEQIDQLIDELARLPERHRSLVIMRFMDGHSYEAIGRKIGRTAHQTRGLCFKAIQQLRRRLARHEAKDKPREHTHGQ